MNFGSNWTLLQSDVNPRFFWWVLSLCHRLTPCKRNWDTCACFNVVMINCYLRYSIMCCTIFFIIWILIGWPVLCMLDGMYSLLPCTGQQQERLLALHAFLTRAVLMGLTLHFFKNVYVCVFYICVGIAFVAFTWERIYTYTWYMRRVFKCVFACYRVWLPRGENTIT